MFEHKMGNIPHPLEFNKVIPFQIDGITFIDTKFQFPLQDYDPVELNLPKELTLPLGNLLLGFRMNSFFIFTEDFINENTKDKTILTPSTADEVQEIVGVINTYLNLLTINPKIEITVDYKFKVLVDYMTLLPVFKNIVENYTRNRFLLI